MGILNVLSVPRSLCAILNIGNVRSTYSQNRQEMMMRDDTLKKPDWLDRHLESLAKELQGVEEDDWTVPARISGNGNMYRLIKALNERSSEIRAPSFICASYDESRLFISDRSTEGPCQTPAYLKSETGCSPKEEFIRLRKLESFVLGISGKSSGFYLSAVNKRASPLEIAMGLKEELKELPVFNEGRFSGCRVHDIIFVFDGTFVYHGYLTHYQRAAELFRVLSSVIDTIQYLSVRTTYKQFSDQLLEAICSLGALRPEYVGEAMKAARNICVISQDKEDIMDSRQELLKEMKELKVESMKPFLDFYKETFRSWRDIVNFSHLYKLALHPDIDLTRSFDKLSGLKCGSQIGRDTETVYTYTLRKKILIAGKLSGFDIRLDPDFGDRDVVSLMNRATTTIEAIRRVDPAKFEKTKFRAIESFKHPDLFVVNPSSKSSAPNSATIMPAVREFDKIKNKMMFKKILHLPDPKPVNDVETTLKGIAELKGDAAFRRFDRTVRLYERFEARFPGLSPEEIAEEDIVTFFKENPDVNYLVLTEPKLGEKHKELTRMFYMGEQALKAVTTRIERIAKQLTRKQTGVSITKSYQSRKGDIEQMADSMLRIKEGYKNMYISFDLSSFSMKYPHQLLRSYGQILSEVTGVDALRRLDLIFKCSLVSHNTRGYKDSLTIVRGAFEGFLNFVWTSSHAVILEIALEESNTRGSMLTYSDDGLLRLTIPDTMPPEEIREMAKKIQQVYKRHGLEFNFSKTMCSDRVWEYLGEVCVEGSMCPTYSKELCSFSTLEDRGDLDLITSRFMTYVSQGTALARSGAPSESCEFLVTYQCLSTLVRIFPDIPIQAIKALLYIPVEAGGLRVPTALEMASMSSIPSSSEFWSDLVLLERSVPKLASLICQYMMESIPERRVAGRSIIMGEYFPSVQGRLDGREIRNWLTDKLRDRLGSVVPKNPLTNSKINLVSEVLRGMMNINPKVISRLIEATPDMQKYLEFTDNVTKSGSLRMLRPEEKLAAMFKDKRMLQSRLQGLRKMLSCKPEAKAIDLGKALFEGYYSEYDVALPKFSLRESVRLAKKGEVPDVTVLFDITPADDDTRSFNDLQYTEPTMSSVNPIRSSMWSEHVAQSVELKDQRKYASFLASILVSCPEVGPALEVISEIFGVRIPPIPPELAENVERIRRSKGKGEDISLFGVKVLRARSIMRFSQRIMSYRDNLQGSDFTTLPGLLRLSASHKLEREGINYRRPSMSVIKLEYVIVSEDMFHNNAMTIKEDFRPPLIDPGVQMSSRLSDEFRHQIHTMIIEAKASCILRELHNYSRKEIDDLTNIATTVWINDLSDWISRMSINEYHAGAAFPALMPIVPLNNPIINREAVREGLFKLMKYDIKAARYNNVDYDVSTSISHFLLSYVGYSDVLESAGIILPPVQIIESWQDTIMGEYEAWRDKRSVLKGALIPVVIVDPKNCHSSSSTAARVAATKQVLECTQDHMYSVCERNKWDSKKVCRELKIRCISGVDDLLNMLSIITPILRKSEHRCAMSPYNKIMARIETAKFILACKSVWKFLDLSSGIVRDDFDTWVDLIEQEGYLDYKLRGELRISFEREFSRGATTEYSHTDHRRVFDEPLYPSAKSRVYAFVKRCMYRRIDFPYKETMTEVHSLNTYFYETILRKCVESMKIYAPSFREVISEEAAAISNMKIMLLTSDQEMGVFTGEFRTSFCKEESKAAFACFLQVTSTRGGYEFKIVDMLPSRLTLLLQTNHFIPDEPKDSAPVIYINSNNSPSFFCIDHQDYVDVARSISYIVTGRGGNAVAFKNGNKYTVIGYAHTPCGNLSVSSIRIESTKEFQESLPSEDMVLCPSLTEWSTNVITSLGYHILPSTRESTPLSRVTDMTMFKNSDIFHVGRSRIQVDDKLLGLASALCSGETSFRGKIISYMLLLKWLRKEDVTSLTDLANEAKVIYNTPFASKQGQTDFRKCFIDDMESCISWMRLLHITPTFESRREFSSLLETYEHVSFRVTIESRPRLPGVINPFISVNAFRPADVLPPEVFKVLYIVTEELPEGDL